MIGFTESNSDNTGKENRSFLFNFHAVKYRYPVLIFDKSLHSSFSFVCWGFLYFLWQMQKKVKYYLGQGSHNLFPGFLEAIWNTAAN